MRPARETPATRRSEPRESSTVDPRRPCTRLSCAASGAIAREQSGRELEQRRHRQSDDVPVVALDRLHQRRPAALDRVAAGPPPPLAVARYQSRSRRRAARKRTRVRRRAWSSSPPVRSAIPLQTSCVAAGERAQHARGLVPVGRLAVDPAVERRRRVGAQHRRPRPRAPCAARSRRMTSAGRPPRRSSTSAGHPEGDAELLEDRPPLRRARGEDEHAPAATSSGKKSRSRARPTRASPSRARWSGPRARSRRGWSRARPRAGWWRR